MKLNPFKMFGRKTKDVVEASTDTNKGQMTQAQRDRQARQREHIRSYAAAEYNRLVKDWPTTGGSADSEIYVALPPVRARSRDLFNNNDYGKKFISMAKTNVVGPKGIGLQARVKLANGKLNKPENDNLEYHWKEWGKVGSCTVDGRLSIVDCENLMIETIARDGEVIIREIKGWDKNPYGYALQFIEPDYLDLNLNKKLSNGNQIRLGIEFDSWRRAVNYYFLSYTPNSVFMDQPQVFSSEHTIVPADQIIHIYVMNRINQSRGMPWIHAAAKRLHMLGGYETAELVASRVSSSKMGFFTSKDGETFQGDPEDPENPDSTDPPVMNADPGTFEELPEGLSFTPWDPQHPTTAYDAFTKGMLRGAASGLNVSYVSLANDLKAVSWSSIRHGAIEERDNWKVIQNFLIAHGMERIRTGWFTMGLLSGAFNRPYNMFQELNHFAWFPRRWQWVDPLKEGKANENDMTNGIADPQTIVGEQGGDFYEVIDNIANAKEYAKERGVELPQFSTQSDTGSQAK